MFYLGVQIITLKGVLLAIRKCKLNHNEDNCIRIKMVGSEKTNGAIRLRLVVTQRDSNKLEELSYSSLLMQMRNDTVILENDSRGFFFS